jgi:hypothetical protein
MPKRPVKRTDVEIVAANENLYTARFNSMSWIGIICSLMIAPRSRTSLPVR